MPFFIMFVYIYIDMNHMSLLELKPIAIIIFQETYSKDIFDT